MFTCSQPPPSRSGEGGNAGAGCYEIISPLRVFVSGFVSLGEEEEELIAMLMFAQQALFSGRDPVK